MSAEVQPHGEQGSAPGSARHWRLQRDELDLVWLIFDMADRSVNTLSREAIAELEALLMSLAQDLPTGLIIESAKSGGFIAGADVREFTRMREASEALEHIRFAHKVFNDLEALDCPSVALIDGYCLGGGTELALACDYRIAVDNERTRLGFPEVRLGIHPGFGGTVRAIRTMGVTGAMDLMLSGRSISARAAARSGLADKAVPERYGHTAAQHMCLERPRLRRAGKTQQSLNHSLLRSAVAAMLKRKVAQRVRREHYPAPFALIDLWRRHGDAPQRMLEEEARSVAELLAADTAQNLVRVFFLQERLKGLGRASAAQVQSVHVIGAGAMGGDIAAWCAVKGLRVTLEDRSAEAIGPAMGRAQALFNKRLKDKRLVQAAADRLIPDPHGLGAARGEVVIEAIFEQLEAKRELFQRLQETAHDRALLATNTSSIPLAELADVLHQPSRLVGLHFFNPVAKMQLVEVVRGPDSASDQIQRGQDFVRLIDRLPLPVQSAPGFLVNRVLMPYLLEAVRMVAEGVEPRAVDAAAERFGMPMGPVALADQVGLDICLSVAEILSQHLDTEVPELLRAHVAAGRRGRKSGKGFYDHGKRRGLQWRKPPPVNPPPWVADRLVFSYLNEAVRCLREGVVEDADLLDAGMIFGTGFAPFRGGPMHYAKTYGVDRIRQRLNDLARLHGPRFEPDPGWDMLAQEDEETT